MKKEDEGEELDAVGMLLRDAAVIDPQKNLGMSRASLPAPPVRGVSGKENVFWGQLGRKGNGEQQDLLWGEPDTS